MPIGVGLEGILVEVGEGSHRRLIGKAEPGGTTLIVNRIDNLRPVRLLAGHTRRGHSPLEGVASPPQRVKQGELAGADIALDVTQPLDAERNRQILGEAGLQAPLVVHGPVVGVVERHLRVAADRGAEVGDSAPEHAVAAGAPLEPVDLFRLGALLCRCERALLIAADFLGGGVGSRNQIADAGATGGDVASQRCAEAAVGQSVAGDR